MIIPSITKKQGIIFGLIVIVAYILPYIIYGEESYITIHDFLDSTIAHIQAILNNNAYFDWSKEIPILSGIPRLSFVATYDIKTLPFLFLSTYWAIVVNIFLVKTVAFIGLFLLLDKYILNEGKYKYLINLGISICFTFIPFYIDYGISTAGIPLIVYAFFNLLKKEHISISYTIIIIYGAYSWLVLSGVFLCLALFIYFLYILVKEKKFALEFFIGLCLLAFVYIATNVNLFMSHFILNDTITHRSEFYSETTFQDLATMVWGIIMNSQYHAGSFNSIIIIICFIYTWIAYHEKDKTLTNYLLWLSFIFGTIIVVNLLKWLFSDCQILRSFQFDRTYFLYPPLCFVIFAVCIQKLFIKNKYAGIILMSFMILFTLIKDSEFRYFVKKTIQPNSISQPSFREFYDKELFDLIEDSIAINKRNEYKIVCLGIFPSVLEYNGYHTLDSYIQEYPLSYKHQFREIISKELDKSEDLKDYFDNWGSRCYIFSSELNRDYLWGKERDGKVTNLEISTEKLKELDCSYIFSAVEIGNYENLNLQLVGEYTTSESYWNIYVYKV